LQRYRDWHRRRSEETGLKLPLVVRLEGNNVVAGKKIPANPASRSDGAFDGRRAAQK
jgi:succinyl-CoA synthetase beta subunit